MFLFSDLDNTLIYSHNRKITQDRIVVEHLDGHEQSYMTKYTYEHFRFNENIELIPITTRTLAQYSRLEFIDAFNIREAIVYNGGMHLINGIEDFAWSKETMQMVNDQLEDFESAVTILEKNYAGNHTVHRPVPYMAYVKTDSPKNACEEIREKVNLENVTVQNDHKKIYVFASRINKGTALQRFCKAKNLRAEMVAGDDVMDISMLNYADCAFVSEKIADLVNNKHKVVLTGEILSDQLCDGIERFSKRVLEE